MTFPRQVQLYDCRRKEVFSLLRHRKEKYILNSCGALQLRSYFFMSVILIFPGISFPWNLFSMHILSILVCRTLSSSHAHHFMMTVHDDAVPWKSLCFGCKTTTFLVMSDAIWNKIRSGPSLWFCFFGSLYKNFYSPFPIVKNSSKGIAKNVQHQEVGCLMVTCFWWLCDHLWSYLCVEVPPSCTYYSF